MVCLGIHPLPNNTFLALSELEAFADDNFNVNDAIILCYNEKIVGKGENAGY